MLRRLRLTPIPVHPTRAPGACCAHPSRVRLLSWRARALTTGRGWLTLHLAAFLLLMDLCTTRPPTGVRRVHLRVAHVCALTLG